MTVLPKRVIHLSSCKYLTKQGVRISLLSFQPKDISLGQNGLGGYDINVMQSGNIMSFLEESWEEREEIHYRKIFGSTGKGISPLSFELFKNQFAQYQYLEIADKEKQQH